MYLSESIQWQDQSATMVGIIPGNAIMNKKPQGRGYVQLEETAYIPWSKDCLNPIDKVISGETSLKTIKAHEFHYSRLDSTIEKLTSKGKFAYKVKRGVGITGDFDGWVYNNLIANYTHLRSTAAYPWTNYFMAFIRSKSAAKNRTRFNTCGQMESNYD